MKHGLSVTERFAFYVSEADPITGCTRWTGGKDAKGYGRFRFAGNQRGRGAHIVALELATREPADGRHALHAPTCPSHDCVNPAHLRWGTNGQNMRDRWNAGGYVHQQKVTDEQVLEIRRRVGNGERQVALSREFGVSAATVSNIVSGRRRALIGG